MSSARAGLSRQLRILSIVLGFAVSALSGVCLLSGRGGVFALLGKLFYPGLAVSLFAMRAVNTNTLVVAFLINAVLYLLATFFLLRWRAGRRSA